MIKAPYPQLANVALDMVSQVSVKGDEQSLMTVLAVRQMLTGIAKGELMVGPVQAPERKLPAGVPDLTTRRTGRVPDLQTAPNADSDKPST